jgi:hypothetical protein
MFQPLIDFFSNFWAIFTTQEVASMTGLEVILLALITLGILKAVKYAFSSAKDGANVVVKFGSNITHFNKHRASKITCTHCGRTLDKCVCANNKGVSYGKRISKHKKEQKLLRKLGRTK